MTDATETPKERILRVGRERRVRALAMREAGLTYRAIGIVFGCGAQRALQLVQRAMADIDRASQQERA